MRPDDEGLCQESREPDSVLPRKDWLSAQASCRGRTVLTPAGLRAARDAIRGASTPQAKRAALRLAAELEAGR